MKLVLSIRLLHIKNKLVFKIKKIIILKFTLRVQNTANVTRDSIYANYRAKNGDKYLLSVHSSY